MTTTATSSRSTLLAEEGFHGTMTDWTRRQPGPHRAEKLWKYPTRRGYCRTITDGQGRVYAHVQRQVRPGAAAVSQRAVPPVGVRRQGRLVQAVDVKAT
ncbi:hypothetical protein NXW50_13705 [Bacteroides thetaiotaomicron]|nr:hypothetical protein [Bacteroides thetaiotaomicron]MCS2279204.1 hypothetical protein [Bacteroides thetaiotaomicron]